MKKMIFVIIGLLLLFDSAEATLVLSASAEVTPSQLVPGSEGYLKLTISNVGTQDLPALYVRLLSIDSPLVLEKNTDLEYAYIGGISAGGSTQKIYKFKVPSGTPSGTYSAGYSVSQLRASTLTTGESSFLTVTGYILIPVQAPSSLVVKSLTPSTFRPGEKASTKITLANTGSARLSSVVLTWQTSGNTILPLGSDNKISLQSIDPGQEVVLPVDMVVSPDATPGVYPLTIKTTYYDQTGTEKTVNSTVGVVIERPGGADISVSLSKSSFSPGEKAEVVFEITNIGESDLSDLSITWSVKDDVVLPLGQGNTLSVKSLKAGEKVMIPQSMIVGTDVIPAIYSLVAKATYSDEKGVRKTDNFTVGVLIGGGTDFQVGLQEISTGTASLSIGNIGVNSAKAISVSVPQQEGVTLTGPSEVFVGNLDPGDFTVASFQLVQSGRGSTLKVQIAYTDASGNRERLEKELKLVGTQTGVEGQRMSQGAGFAQRAHTGAQSGYRNILIGAGSLAGISLIYFAWRRKKQK